MWFLARSRSNTFDAWPSCLLAPALAIGFQSPMLFRWPWLWPLFCCALLLLEPYGFRGCVDFGAICFSALLASGVHWLLVPFDIGALGH